MRMELKYLASYLPYELKCNLMGECVEDSGFDDTPIAKIFTITGISNIGTKEIEIGNLFIHADDSEYHHEVELSEVFPLLLPLSALIEPMEDGSLPIYKLLNADKGDFEWKFVKGKLPFQDRFEIWTYPESFYEEGDIPSQLIESIHINSILSQPYHRIEKLFEWHFDVFKLIPAGLAIDKRTIK